MVSISQWAALLIYFRSIVASPASEFVVGIYRAPPSLLLNNRRRSVIEEKI